VLANCDLTDGGSLISGADPIVQQIQVVIGNIAEFRVPHKLLGAQHGDRLRLRFSLWREKLPVDALPVEGWLDLRISSDAELEENTYNFSIEN
jgi:hypothetical protein